MQHLVSYKFRFSSRMSDQSPHSSLTVGGPSSSNVALISSWYNGRCVLVTGATGFMGKVLVEKLLRSCPGVRRVYLLLRPKRGVEPEQRLREMTGITVRILLIIHICCYCVLLVHHRIYHKILSFLAEQIFTSFYATDYFNIISKVK